MQMIQKNNRTINTDISGSANTKKPLNLDTGLKKIPTQGSFKGGSIMKPSILLKICFAITILLSFNTAIADDWKDESGKGKGKKHAGQYRNDNGRDSYFHKNGYTHLNIPKGHYPPPGQCRIWYPDKPPGHQPPPGNCRQLRSSVPPGAWIIRRPHSDSGHIHVDVYDQQRRGRIMVSGMFDLAGVFIRIAAGL